MSKEILKITVKFQGGIKGFIPKGIKEQITIEIVDEIAAFHFLDNKFTKALSISQKKSNFNSVYSERLQKTICRFPNMKRDEIYFKLKKDFKEIGINL